MNSNIITAENIEAGMEIASSRGSYIVLDVIPLTGGYVKLHTTQGVRVLPCVRPVGVLS